MGQEKIEINKGEWSEVLTVIKLLAEGKLHAADSDLNAIPDVYYPLIKILRNERDNPVTKNTEFQYHGDYKKWKDAKVKIVNGDTNNTLLEIPVRKFRDIAPKLFEDIVNGKGRTFPVSDEVDDFLKEVHITQMSERADKKRDITIVVHDLITGFNPTLGFSIKSKIGKPATLLNASGATHFIYNVKGDFSEDDINEINSYSRISDKINKIESKGGSVVFKGLQNEIFKSNLQMIDSRFPEILSEILLYYYKGLCKSNLVDLLQELKNRNPLGYTTTSKHPFYSYKIKNFLTDVALGMRPSEMWGGVYDANGGYLIVKKDGEIVCYHVYNRDEFQEYLVKNTRLEQADRGRHQFGYVYEENEEYKIKLNLQIRFT